MSQRWRSNESRSERSRSCSLRRLRRSDSAAWTSIRSLVNAIERADSAFHEKPRHPDRELQSAAFVTVLGLDDALPDRYARCLRFTSAGNSVGQEKAEYMPSSLRLIRDDEERLSAPAFQRSSSRVLSFPKSAKECGLQRLADLYDRDADLAEFVDSIVQDFLRDAG